MLGSRVLEAAATSLNASSGEARQSAESCLCEGDLPESEPKSQGSEPRCDPEMMKQMMEKFSMGFRQYTSTMPKADKGAGRGCYE